MSGDSSSVGAGSPPGVFERAPAAAQAGLAALATAVADAEHRAAELAEAFDERTAELTQARERVAYLESTLAQRDQELALRLQRLVEIKASLSWQLMTPFRELYRPIRRLQETRFGVRLRAAWRHPTNSRKRKAFRSNRMGEYAAAHPPLPHRPTKSAAKVRALVSHPFSSKLRRACRERLRGVPPGPARLPNSHGAEAALTSARVSSTVEHAYTEPQAERPLAAPYGPIYKVLKSDASAHKLQAATHRLRSDPAEFRTLFIKNEWPAELREQLGFGKAVWE